MKVQKLVIIGLDAADYQLTQDFMERGDLPRLSAIRERNCFSCLKSVVPPHTAPGWTSITTGVNPGKHGIYYFHNFGTSPPTITNSTNTTTPRIWDYVGSLHENSVVVNVPVTYPVHKISGSMVAGIPPWFMDERSVSSEDLSGKLNTALYEIDVPMSKSLEKRPDELVRRLVATEDSRVNLFLSLLKESSKWSFGMIVITALDRMQHKLLGKEGEKETNAVRRGYHEIDNLVGRIFDSLRSSNVNFLIVSDHGLSAKKTAFYPNVWLHRHGLLERKSRTRYRITRYLHDLLDGHFLWVPQSMTKRFQGAAVVVQTIDAVDLVNSRAFVPGTDGIIVVKTKEDDKAIISGLTQLRDDSGMEICTVYSRDQIYKGNKVASAPELLIIPRDDINIRNDPFSRKTISTSGNFPRSNHSPNGIFFATGPSIGKASGLNVCLEDIAPTSLSLMGMRPPDFMDGHIMDEIMLEHLRSLDILEPTTVSGDDENLNYSFSPEEDTANQR